MHAHDPLRDHSPSPRAARTAPAYPRCLGALVVAAGLCMGCEKEPVATAGTPPPAFADGGTRTSEPATAASHGDPEVMLGGAAPEPFAPAAGSAK